MVADHRIDNRPSASAYFSGEVPFFAMVPESPTLRISSSACRSRSVQRRKRLRKLRPAGQAGLAVEGKMVGGAVSPLRAKMANNAGIRLSPPGKLRHAPELTHLCLPKMTQAVCS